MTSTAYPTPATMPAMVSPKQQFLNAFEMEHATTMRVLRAYPTDKMELSVSTKDAGHLQSLFLFLAAAVQASTLH